MFGLRIGCLCLVVSHCILLAVSHSTNESVCVLSDAPQQCGAFCLTALHPLYAKSRELENSQEAIVKMIADSRAEQKEFLNHYYQTARELLNETSCREQRRIQPPSDMGNGRRQNQWEYVSRYH